MGLAASGPVLDIRTPFGPLRLMRRHVQQLAPSQSQPGETRGQAAHRVSSALVVMPQCEPGGAGAED